MGGISNTQTDDSEGNGTSTSVNLLGPVFRAEIDRFDYDVGDLLVLIASATVCRRDNHDDDDDQTDDAEDAGHAQLEQTNNRCMEIRLYMFNPAITKMNQR
jgi:hypothetical protein